MTTVFEVGKKYKNTVGWIMEILFIGNQKVVAKDVNNEEFVLRRCDAEAFWKEYKEPVVTERWVVVSHNGSMNCSTKSVAILMAKNIKTNTALCKVTLIDGLITKLEQDN